MSRPYVFGVDVGGSSVKIGFFRREGSLLEKWEIPTRKENGGAHILPDIASSVLAYLEQKEITPEEVEGIGIAVPGAVPEEGIVNRCVNLGWGVRPVGKELSDLLRGMKVRVANDANAAALGEAKAAGDRKSVIVITIGTGIGGGIILDGKIAAGAFGAAGEIGHIPVRADETEVCGCGKRGCLEQYASAEGIVRLAKKRLAETEAASSLRKEDPLTARAVFQAAKSGDETALELVDEVCRMIGRGLAAVACVIDPEAFIIGGGVSAAGQILISGIKKYYREYAFHASRETEILPAALGNDAGIYGAMGLLSE